MSDTTTVLPIAITSTGLVPRMPADILAQLLQLVQNSNPDYTANLPGLLIEDISSTDVAAISLIDQCLVELINSLSPYTANPYLMTQLGNVYGVPQGVATNTSVFIQFFSSTPGFPVPQGFIVGDGTHQYATQQPTIVGANGVSPLVFCVATTPGSWAVPMDAVNDPITSIPDGVTLNFNNPVAGVPGAGVESEQAYRARVLQSGIASATGMARLLKTALGNVPGIQTRLVSVQQQSPGWKIIAGGGDPYLTANAIFNSLFDVSQLVGSVLTVASITKANPAVITTFLNHGLVDGQESFVNGATGMTAINGVPLVTTVIDEKTFSTQIDSSGFGTYTGSGVVTPNNRNVVVNISDYPDTYTIPYIDPPAQAVHIVLTWNTNAPNYINPAAVAQLGNPALVNYINGIDAGQPINLFELQTAFAVSIAAILPTPFLSRMLFAIYINNVMTSVDTGTGLIVGDPESYFLTSAGQITIQQG